MRGTKAKAGHRRKRPEKTESMVRHAVCRQCGRYRLIMRETGTCWLPHWWDKCRERGEKLRARAEEKVAA